MQRQKKKHETPSLIARKSAPGSQSKYKYLYAMDSAIAPQKELGRHLGGVEDLHFELGRDKTPLSHLRPPQRPASASARITEAERLRSAALYPSSAPTVRRPPVLPRPLLSSRILFLLARHAHFLLLRRSCSGMECNNLSCIFGTWGIQGEMTREIDLPVRVACLPAGKGAERAMGDIPSRRASTGRAGASCSRGAASC